MEHNNEVTTNKHVETQTKIHRVWNNLDETSSFKCDRQMTIATRMRQFRLANHMTEGLFRLVLFVSLLEWEFIRMRVLLYQHGTAMSWAFNVMRGKQLEQDWDDDWFQSYRKVSLPTSQIMLIESFGFLCWSCWMLNLIGERTWRWTWPWWAED